MDILIALLSWSGQGDAISWLLSGILLLLAIVATLILLPQTVANSTNRWRSITPIWLLTIAALPAIWADSPRSLLTGWTVLTAVYILLSFFTQKQNQFPTVGWFTAVYTLLLGAAAIAPADAGWKLTAYPQAMALLFMAAFIQIGSWPAQRWVHQASSMGWVQTAVSALAGGMILIRLAGTTIPYSALFTLLAAISLLYGVYRLWLPSVTAKREGVLLIAAGMLGQTAVWGMDIAVLSELRLLIFATPLLIMALQQPPTGKWRKLPPLLAAGAFIGLPLTAGFTGHTALYGGLIANGNFILVATTTLLQMIVLATLLTAVLRPQTAQFSLPSTSDSRSVSENSAIGLQDIASGLLVAGLLSFQVNRWLDAGAASWLILLVSFVGGGALYYYMGTQPAWLTELPSTIAEAFAPTETMVRGVRGGRWVLTAVYNAINDAINILEGENGLVWLLAIGLLILLTT